MSIASGIAKAAKAQSRGLTGKRNSQGDFMPEEVQMKGVQDSVELDIQNYIDDVKAQIDEIDVQLEELYSRDTGVDTPGVSAEQWDAEIKRLEQDKFTLIELTLERLEEEGVEPPPELIRMKTELYNPDAYKGMN